MLSAPLPPTVPLDDLLSLSVPQKLALIGALWESIGDDGKGGQDPPDWHIAALEQRLLADRSSPEATVTWDEAQKNIEERYGQSRST